MEPKIKSGLVQKLSLEKKQRRRLIVSDFLAAIRECSITCGWIDEGGGSGWYSGIIVTYRFRAISRNITWSLGGPFASPLFVTFVLHFVFRLVLLLSQ